MRELQTLATETRSEVRGSKKQAMAFIEAAVARNYIAEGWHERVFQGIPKTPDTPSAPLIHTSAVLPLASDPARMLAAESIARSIFRGHHMIWTAASYVDVGVFIDPVTYRRRVPRVMHVRAHGVVRWQRDSVLVRGMDNVLCHWDAKSLWERVRVLHPNWEPLLDLGVVPWMYTQPEKYKVALLCPETPKGVTLSWVSRVYTPSW